MHKEYNKMSSKYRSFNVRDKIDASSCRLVSSLEPGRGIKFASPRNYCQLGISGECFN